jgi:thiamine biosynthesis lipoprotein
MDEQRRMNGWLGRPLGRLVLGIGIGLVCLGGWLPLAAAATPVVPPLASTVAPRALERYEFRRDVFGMEARLDFYTTDDITAGRAAEAAWARFDELDAVFSDWRPDSELSRLTDAVVGAEVPVGVDLFTLLSKGQRLHEITEGAFDLTVGPYVAIWREARTWNRLPDARALAACRERVGMELLTLLPDDPTTGEAGAGRVILGSEDMQLTVGGLAKGYAVQQVLLAMKAAGVNRALVELGGDVAAGDPPPDRDAWETLAGCGPGRSVRVSLVNECLSVSGDPEQALVVDGVHHSQVLDPRTGEALTQRTCVSVVSADGALADALASTVQILGPREGRRFVAAMPDSRLVHVERVDQPIPSQFHDPLRVASRLQPLDMDPRVWSADRDVLMGRLFASPAIDTNLRFETNVSWVFEMQADGDRGADLVLHPDANHPGKGALRLPVGGGHGNHWEVRVAGFRPTLQVWRDGLSVGEWPLGDPQEGDAVRSLGLSLVPAGPVREVRPYTLTNKRAGKRGGKQRGERVAMAGSRGERLGVVRLRNLRLRELTSVEVSGFKETASGLLELTERGVELGWKNLIAAGLPEWVEHTGSYSQKVREHLVIDDVLQIPKTGGAQLRTEDDYQDFRLRLDFKLAPGANSGLFLRGDRKGGDPAYSGCEIQIIDDHGWERIVGSALKDTQQCGSLYAAVPANAPGALKRAGEWNTYELLYLGSRLTVALNGTLLYDVDTHELEDAKPPFAERVAMGFIGLQRYGAPHVEGPTALWVRNMFVRPLVDDVATAGGEDSTDSGDR